MRPLHHLRISLLALLLPIGWARGQGGLSDPAVTAVDLLAPEMFPTADMGMEVESAEDGAKALVVTTGAEFVLNKAASTIECRQRIARSRTVSILTLPPGSLASVRLTHRSSGAAIFSGGGTTVRVNGDSLLMVAPGTDGPMVATLAFTPDFHNGYAGNYNFFDPFGGISFFEHGRHPDARLTAARDPVRVAWNWKAGDVLWASVSPPKPYDWAGNLKFQLVVYGTRTDRYMYPSDHELLEMKRHATVLHLHQENMWEHWQLSLVPRDKANYLRVMRTARRLGLKVTVYASPRYFVKGTQTEPFANPSPRTERPDFTGRNARIYLAQITRLVKEFDTQGIYFDGIYNLPRSLASEYFVTRSARELLTGGKTLIIHLTTGPLGDGHHGVVFPALDAYADMMYRGESEWKRWDAGYERYILGTYNVSNTLANQVTDSRFVPEPEQIEFNLRNNVRPNVSYAWFFSGQNELLFRSYWPRLTPALKQEIEPYLAQPTGVFAQFRKSIAEEEQ